MIFDQDEYKDPQIYDAEYGSYLPMVLFLKLSLQKGISPFLTWLVEQGG